ncbi:hypothetical protein QQF64_032112 [Cirrhinus molitorella]|uniref:Uncharacterized protein n=1 Tax=Cirrhinus molitorella TaxID=172907 RepID=A0ABR3MYV6_9TELE
MGKRSQRVLLAPARVQVNSLSSSKAQDVQLNALPLSPVGPCCPNNTFENTSMKHTCAFHSPTPVVSSRYPSSMCGPGSPSSMETSEWLSGFVEMCGVLFPSARLFIQNPAAHAHNCCTAPQALCGAIVSSYKDTGSYDFDFYVKTPGRFED